MRIGWIHTDYSYINPTRKYKKRLEYEYSKMDSIAAVSDDCGQAFNKVFPFYKPKVFTIENILSANYIQSQANLFTVNNEIINDGSINLLSIGRFHCQSKNFDNVPDICKRLHEFGLKVKWYMIGFGIDEGLIKQKIKESNMEEYVIILGKKSNPYPYIKFCDIYVQPSRYEGKCVAVREAQILNKPVIITNYPTATSQLKDGYDGVIVPLDNENCAEGIAKVIRNKNLQKKLIENTKMNDYTNSEEINKIYKLLGITE